MKLKCTEQQILNTILDYLKLCKVPHVHVRNTGSIIHRPDGKVIFGRCRSPQIGAADVVGVCNGIAFAFEVKSITGKVRPEQVEWLSSWGTNGGKSFIVRSLTEAMAFIEMMKSEPKGDTNGHIKKVVIRN